MLTGRTTADLARNFFVMILMCIVGFAVGWRIISDVWGLLAMIAPHPRVLVLALVDLRVRRFEREGRGDRAGGVVPDPRAADLRVVGVHPRADDAGLAPAVGGAPAGVGGVQRRARPHARPARAARDTLKALAWIVGIVAVFAPLAVRKYRKIA